MRSLSPRQRDAYVYIQWHLSTLGIAPSRKEIASALGIKSPSAVDVHLRALALKGWLELLPDTQRGIRLIGTGDLPLLYVGNLRPRDVALDPNRDAVARISGRVVALFPETPTYLLELVGTGLHMRFSGRGRIFAIRTVEKPVTSAYVVARHFGYVRCGQFRRLDQRDGEFKSIIAEYERPRKFEPIDLECPKFRIEGIAIGELGTFPVETSREKLGGIDDLT